MYGNRAPWPTCREKSINVMVTRLAFAGQSEEFFKLVSYQQDMHLPGVISRYRNVDKGGDGVTERVLVEWDFVATVRDEFSLLIQAQFRCQLTGQDFGQIVKGGA